MGIYGDFDEKSHKITPTNYGDNQKAKDLKFLSLFGFY